MDTVAVILAGGKGSRFWPRSQADQPKQFLALVRDNETLLQAAHARARAVAGAGHVYAVLPEEYVQRTSEQVPDLSQRLIVEPSARDTAAAVALAAYSLSAVEDPCLVFLPADHWVADEKAFVRAVQAAVDESARGGVWVLGLQPGRPETAYGYIVPEGSGDGAVEKFVEKPALDLARSLVASGALWNAGIFVARASELTRAIEACAPEVAVAARDAVEGRTEAYSALAAISFDYAVLERWHDVRVTEASFAWDDVGTWTALDRLVPTDESGNVVRGTILAHDAERAILVNDDPERDLVALGVRDIVCVASPRGVLVAAKDRVGDIKRVYPALRSKTEQIAFSVPAGATTVAKPWGREIWWAQSAYYLAKVLEVKPWQALSLQYHEHKHETAVAVAGTGWALVGERERRLRPGVRVEVPPGTVHRFRAGAETLVLLEVSTPEADDVVRLEDRYGRAEVAATDKGAAG